MEDKMRTKTLKIIVDITGVLIGIFLLGLIVSQFMATSCQNELSDLRDNLNEKYIELSTLYSEMNLYRNLRIEKLMEEDFDSAKTYEEQAGTYTERIKNVKRLKTGFSRDVVHKRRACDDFLGLSYTMFFLLSVSYILSLYCYIKILKK